jgi:hypothetical protein
VLPAVTELLPLIEIPATATVESSPEPLLSSADTVQPENAAANTNAATSIDNTGIIFIFILKNDSRL